MNPQQTGEFESTDEHTPMRQRQLPHAGLSFFNEASLVLLAIAIFLIINIATCDKYPAVWSDEVMYQDPAVNLYQAHGFTSSAWWLQQRTAFWAGNVPFYQFALFGWLKIFGFSITTVRSFHYCSVGTAVFIAWLAVRRLNLITSSANRLLCCAVLILCSAATFVYRAARPESFGILIVACAFLSFSFRPRWRSLVMLAFCGILLTGAGLQLAAYTAVMSGLIFLCGPRRLLPEMATLCIGCALGGGILYLFYLHNGVWTDFVNCIRLPTIANKGTHYAYTHEYGSGVWVKLRQLPGLYADYSYIPLVALAVWMAWRQYRARTLRLASPLFFGLAASICVPLALHVVGIFPIYYFWMALFPLVIGLFSQLGDWQKLEHGKFARSAAIALIAVSCLVGLPRRLAVAAFDWKARSYVSVMALVEPYVGHDKLVMTEFAAYYAAKQHAAELILPSYVPLLSDSDKAKITVAILRNGDTAWLAKLLGGQWRDTGAALSPPLPMSSLRENLDSREYRLRVFIREPSTAN